MTKITACTMDCPDACSLLVSTNYEGKVVIQGNPNHPITEGMICGKIKKFHGRLSSPDRIVTPLLKKNGRWEKISWEEALELCAEKIQKLRDQNPEQILHIHGDGAKGVLKQVGKLFFSQLGASNLRGSLCDAAGYIAYVNDFGSRNNSDPRDLLNSKRIVNWGKDFSRSSVHMAAIVQKARKMGTRVVSISPGGDANRNFCDDHITIRPGTDRFLAAVVIHRLIRHGYPSEKIRSRIRNWDSFHRLIMDQSESNLLSQCDVSPKMADLLLEYYEDPGPTASVLGAGLQRYDYGGENVRFINALAVLSGNMGFSGGGSYFHLHSFKNLNLEWIKTKERKKVRRFSTPLLSSELENAEPPVKMIWVNGSNIVNQVPEAKKMARLFEQTEFTVVVDAFMTDTAKRATLFLPSCLMLEQEDIIGSFLHDYVHYVPRVLDPPGEARSDYWIFSRLARKLDPAPIILDKESCFQKSLATDFMTVSVDALKAQNFVHANRPFIAYENMVFDHPDSKCRLPNSLHPEPEAPEKYPLRLLSLVRRDVIHSQMLAEKQKSTPTVWVCPETIREMNLDTGRKAFLCSSLGKLEVVLEKMEGLYPNAVIYRRGDWMCRGGGVNALIGAAATDIGNGAAFYSQYVTIEQEPRQWAID